MIRRWYTIFLLVLFPVRASSIRTDPTSLPNPTFIRSGCRVIINEFNTYTNVSTGKQFVELLRVCPRKSSQRSKRMDGFKLLFIDSEGFLLGVCDLEGDMRLYTDTVDVPNEDGSKKYKYTRKGWFFTIGSHSNEDYERSKCNLVNVGSYDNKEVRFPLGISAPFGMALIYSEKPSVLSKVRMEKRGSDYLKTFILPQTEKIIRSYLQDFYLVGAATFIVSCDYFRKFYVFDTDTFALLRDWNVELSRDNSVSRCILDRTVEVLPMKPQEWLQTTPSPGEFNHCETGVRFQIENFQDERIQHYRKTQSSQFCFSTTQDEANSKQMIIYPQEYRRALEADFKDKASNLGEEFFAIPAEIADDGATPENIKGSSFCEPLLAETTTITPDTTNSPQRRVEIFIPNPIDSDQFERNLETQKPFIWTDCTRLDKQMMADLTRKTNAYENPIKMEKIMRKDVCYWVKYYKTSNLFQCHLCNKLLNQGIIFDKPGARQVTDIMKSGVRSQHPLKFQYLNFQYIKYHKTSIYHKMTEDWFKLYDEGYRGKSLAERFENSPDGHFSKFIQSTRHLITAVMQAVKLGLPFSKFKALTDLIEFFGVDIGTLYQSPNGMRTVVESMSDKIHADFVSELLNEKPPISILLDGTSDIQKIPILAILFQTTTVKDGTKLRLYKIIRMDSGEKGSQIYSALISNLRKDGLEAYVKTNLQTTTSDGAGNVHSVFARLMDTFTSRKILPIWCANHWLDLCYKHTVKEHGDLQLVSKIVNMLYKIFSMSPQRKSILRNVTIDLGGDPFTIKKTHIVRWVNSNTRSLEIVLYNYKYIIAALRKILRLLKLDPATVVKVKFLISQLEDPVFITHLAFLVQISNRMSIVSLTMSKAGQTLIGKKSLITDLIVDLENYKTVNADSVDYLLNNSKYQDSDNPLTSVKEFETKSITFFGVKLNTNPSSLTSGLHVMRVKYLSDLIDYITFYTPQGIQEYYEVFDPLNFPTSENRVDTYGIGNIKKLNTQLNWAYNETALVLSWKNLIRGLLSDENFNNMKTESPELFWKFYLNSNSVGFDEITTHVILKVLTSTYSNVATERLLSLYSRVKTFQRYMLMPKTVESILRVRLNTPENINDFDGNAFAKDFLLSGHTRADGINRAAKPLQKSDWDHIMDINNDDAGEDDETDDACES